MDPNNPDLSTAVARISELDTAIAYRWFWVFMIFLLGVIAFMVLLYALDRHLDWSDWTNWLLLVVLYIIPSIAGISGIMIVSTAISDESAEKRALAEAAYSQIEGVLHERYDVAEVSPWLGDSSRSQTSLSNWLLKATGEYPIHTNPAQMLILTQDGQQLLWDVEVNLETGESALLTPLDYTGALTPTQLEAKKS